MTATHRPGVPATLGIDQVRAALNHARITNASPDLTPTEVAAAHRAIDHTAAYLGLGTVTAQPSIYTDQGAAAAEQFTAIAVAEAFRETYDELLRHGLSTAAARVRNVARDSWGVAL